MKRPGAQSPPRQPPCVCNVHSKSPGYEQRIPALFVSGRWVLIPMLASCFRLAGSLVFAVCALGRSPCGMWPKLLQIQFPPPPSTSCPSSFMYEDLFFWSPAQLPKGWARHLETSPVDPRRLSSACYHTKIYSNKRASGVILNAELQQSRKPSWTPSPHRLALFGRSSQSGLVKQLHVVAKHFAFLLSQRLKIVSDIKKVIKVVIVSKQ